MTKEKILNIASADRCDEREQDVFYQPADLNEKGLQAALESIRRTVANIFEAFNPIFDAFCSACREALSTLGDALQQTTSTEPWEFILAYSWACGARPEWVRRLNHTKKKRIRKKYQDRILRAYRETRGAGTGSQIFKVKT